MSNEFREESARFIERCSDEQLVREYDIIKGIEEIENWYDSILLQENIDIAIECINEECTKRYIETTRARLQYNGLTLVSM